MITVVIMWWMSLVLFSGLAAFLLKEITKNVQPECIFGLTRLVGLTGL